MAKASRAGTRPAATRGAGRAADPLWDRFLRELAVVLPILELEVGGESGDLVTLTTADGQRKGQVNLASLFRVVSGKPRSQWFALIHRYLSVAGPDALAEAAEAILERGLVANAARLRPCLKAAPPAGDGIRVWSQPLADPDPVADELAAALAAAPSPAMALARLSRRRAAARQPCTEADTGLSVAIGIDLPDMTAFVTEEMLRASARSGHEWLQYALENLRRHTPARWSHVLHRGCGLRYACVRDGYDAARALILDALLPGKAPRGWFVAPVDRDSLTFLPATEKAAERMLVSLARQALADFRTATHPISRDVWWVYEGRWHRFPLVTCDRRWHVTVPPQPFLRVFGLTDQLERFLRNASRPR